VFKLCDKYGCTFAFDLYAGKKDVENGLGLDTNVVLKLAEPYLDAGRTVFTPACHWLVLCYTEKHT